MTGVIVIAVVATGVGTEAGGASAKPKANEWNCRTCGAEFRSRNRLFKHIKKTGHAIIREEEVEVGSTWKKSRKKKKKKRGKNRAQDDESDNLKIPARVQY